MSVYNILSNLKFIFFAQKPKWTYDGYMVIRAKGSHILKSNESSTLNLSSKFLKANFIKNFYFMSLEF